MAVREGDELTTGHSCAAKTTLALSLVRTVKANGIYGAVKDTPTVSHLFPNDSPPPECISHKSKLKQGSPNVLIGGIPWGREEDSADAGAMLRGSLNVLVNGR